MDTKQNPFKPSFGKTPPILIGREFLIEDFMDALDGYESNESSSTLYVGQRGMGKTVLLNEIGRHARNKQWVVVEVSMTDSLLEKIYDKLRLQSQKYLEHASKKITGINLNIFGIGGGVTTTTTPEDDFSIPTKIELIIDELSRQDIGVLFTIDEIIADSVELREFASMYQLIVRKNCKVAVAVAGLPHEISRLLNDRILTFLWRAERINLTNVDIRDVAAAFITTFRSNEVEIANDMAQKAAASTEGYPYLTQLVGSRIWDATSNNMVTMESVEHAVPLAMERLFKNVIEPVVTPLPNREIAYLKAMAQDEGISKTSDIAARMGAAPSSTSQFRKNLIERNIVHTPKRGELAFVTPYMRDYLLQY